MVGRIMTPFERTLTTTVNDIEHTEATSYTSSGIAKIFFHPGVSIATANAQVTAISQTIVKQMPPGETPPLIVNYSASTVPIIQLALSGAGLTEQTLTDLGTNFLRTRLVTVQGAAVPYPFGGKVPQIMFDLDTAALQARGTDRPRCRQCSCAAESAHARRHRKDRRLRVHHQSQQRALQSCGSGGAADQERRWCDGVHA